MEVNVHGDGLADVEPQQQLLERVHSRMQLRRRARPPTVQIDRREGAAVIAADDLQMTPSVGVEHGHDQEEAVPAERVGLRSDP